jgi:hypothetical protein
LAYVVLTRCGVVLAGGGALACLVGGVVGAIA